MTEDEKRERHVKRIARLSWSLNFDLIVPKDFTWGGKAFEMMLAKENSERNYETSLILRLRPGFNGSGGRSTLNISSPSGTQ